jgi:hypothetical protein
VVRHERFRKEGMMRRLTIGMLAGLLALTLGVPASASPPERERFIDDTRVTYDCDGVLITEDGGHYEGHFLLKVHRDERVRAVFSASARQVTATDQFGNTYRISGSGSGTALWDSMEAFEADEDPNKGHFGIRLVIRHADGGKFGHVWFRAQVLPDGEVSFVERGDCEDLGPA